MYHWHCYKTMPFVKMSHLATDLLKALHGTPSSSNMQTFSLLVSSSFFVFGAPLMRFLSPSLPHKPQSHVLGLGQPESLSLPPLCRLVSFAAVQLAVEAEALVGPPLEVVDAVESRVVVLPDEDPLIA